MKKYFLMTLLTGMIIASGETLDSQARIPQNISAKNPEQSMSLERIVSRNNILQITRTLRQTTRSQMAVNAMIREDLDHLQKTGFGLYLGKPIKTTDYTPELESIKKYHKVVDCSDAWRVVLNAELPHKRKEIFRNARDQEGNFSAPFAVQYLSQKEQWDVFGIYAEKYYKNFDEKRQIIDEDLAMGFNQKDEAFYSAGGGRVKIKLDEIVPLEKADSLLRQLTLERGYGLGFQRDGNHVFALTQEGLFEIHSDAFPLGYKERKSPLIPLDLHKGRYHARSSIAIFAFPKKGESISPKI